MKVLLSGDVNGKWNALFKRVSAVNKSNGPFDLLLCTGRTFPDAGPTEDNADIDAELQPYLDGSKLPPIPCYFIGAYGHGCVTALKALQQAGSAGLTYLGRSGLETLQGLRIAFLDGTHSSLEYTQGPAEHSSPSACRHFTKEDVQALELAAEEAVGDVDILLTCEWPADVTAATPPGSAPAEASTAGSEVVSKLATKVRPRYHICGGKDVFYARQPYLNKDLGAGGHVTRFIALASVGNPAKAKSLHALALTPAADMDIAVLTQRPDGTTPCPYELPNSSKRALNGQDDDTGGQDWRWQQNKKSKISAAPSLGRPGVVKDNAKTVYVRNLPFAATEQDIDHFFSQAGHVEDVRRGAGPDGKLHGYGFVQFETQAAAEQACQLHGSDFMGRQLTVDVATAVEGSKAPTGTPVEGCWFCLSNPNADVNLVASIGEESYVALDKGAITDSHVLVLPIEHFPSSLHLSASAFAEMERYLSALRTCFASQGKELLVFERFMNFRKTGGNHCQLNVISVSAKAAAGAAATAEKAAQGHSLSLQPVPGASKGEPGREALRQVVANGEFFLLLLPDGSRLVHPIAMGERFPLNFGREVMAQLAGAPDRADWKKCMISPDEEASRTESFKAHFKPYDIMQ
ncbi:hypothetical protein CVIRNUC_007699 [Coccomyxa viridis]|uniref:RRM domain-containing protein n=1 Tax=Coccomyxa viridis TaxID=1274662 RepID=A0AAV1IDF9_9CHLO|nr:hypothetical protein CVIRNUC_007699 [Coccomyxa viridis]